MKLILFLLIISNLLIAKGLKSITSGYFDAATGYEEISGYDNTNNYCNTKSIIFNINNDLISESYKISTSLGYQGSTPIYNNILNTDTKYISVILLNELLLEYKLSDNFSIAGGVIPFRYGTFNEYSMGGNVRGNGLAIISSHVTNGVFVTNKFDNLTTIVGYGSKDALLRSEYPTNGETYIEFVDGYTLDYKGSDGLYLITKYTNNEHYVEFNYYYSNTVIGGSKVLTSNIFGLGYSYDDSVNSGNIFYGSLMYSNSEGNTAALNDGVTVISDYTHFGPVKNSGVGIYLGYKNISVLQVQQRDISINLEYTHLQPGFYSLNPGEPFTPYSYSDYGDSYYATIGIQYERDILINIRSKLYENDNNVIPPGGVVNTIKNPSYGAKRITYVGVEVIYSF